MLHQSLQLIRPAEAAAILAVAPATIYRWLKSGRLPAVRLGPGAVRIDCQALNNFVLARTTSATTIEPATTTQEATPDGK